MMKKLLTLLVISALLGGAFGGSAHQFLRRADIVEVKCLALKRLTEYEGAHGSEESWDCELSDGSILTLDGLDELDSPEIVGQFESGVSEITIPKGVVSETSITIPPTSRIQVDSIQSNMNGTTTENIFQDQTRRLVDGARKVLAIRVTDSSGKSTSFNAQSLSDKLFFDSPNFCTQFDRCSYGKLTFEPTTSLLEDDPDLAAPGVYEITIPKRVTNADHALIREAVSRKLREDWKETLLPAKYSQNHPSDTRAFDHAFYCLPPGTAGDWKAYGYENGWLTVYNDNWCHRLAANMHELGHNLAVHHSGDLQGTTPKEKEYGDQSGYMGAFPNYNDAQARMCFNGPKSWKLSWYQDKSVLVSPSTASWQGRLRGMCDYDKEVTNTVLVKIESGTDTDYYVTFNRQAGINADTLEGADQVLLTMDGTNGVGYGISSLVTKLSKWSTYTIQNFGGSNRNVRISVNKINTIVETGYADVKVEMLCTAHWQCERNDMFACPSHCNKVTNTCEVTSGCNCDNICNTEGEDEFQCPSDCGERLTLETTLEGSVSHAGSMFDVKAKNNVQITSFEIQSQDAGAYINAYVFAKIGSYSSNDNDKDKWTHIQTARVKSEGEGAWTKLPDLPNAISVSVDRMQSFYVTLDTNRMLCGDGRNEGLLFGSNDDIEVFEGIGKSYLFGDTHSAQRFSGRINYVKVQEAPSRGVTNPTSAGITVPKAQAKKRRRKKRKKRARKKKRRWWFTTTRDST